MTQSDRFRENWTPPHSLNLQALLLSATYVCVPENRRDGVLPSASVRKLGSSRASVLGRFLGLVPCALCSVLDDVWCGGGVSVWLSLLLPSPCLWPSARPRRASAAAGLSIFLDAADELARCRSPPSSVAALSLFLSLPPLPLCSLSPPFRTAARCRPPPLSPSAPTLSLSLPLSLSPSPLSAPSTRPRRPPATWLPSAIVALRSRLNSIRCFLLLLSPVKVRRRSPSWWASSFSRSRLPLGPGAEVWGSGPGPARGSFVSAPIGGSSWPSNLARQTENILSRPSSVVVMTALAIRWCSGRGTASARKLLQKVASPREPLTPTVNGRTDPCHPGRTAL